MPEQPRGELALRTLAMPRDTNANGDIFGGWIVSQMDLGASITAKNRAKCRTVTVAIDKMVFRQPVYVGDTLCCYTDLEKVGRTSMTINVQVWATGIDEDRRLVTEGVFTFVAISSRGKAQPVDR
ncbi:MAG: acyl-CoA thioesterase [Gammaproteobacteria bacterium]|nr:acyl-CoA thioesterase [Gammaproteobacteria bacterium]